MLQYRTIDDIIIRSPLVSAVEEAIEFIKKNIRLAFIIGGDTLKREERWQYPISALREILLNSIVHRDYTNPTDVIIKIFDDSIEITNPGKLMGDLSIEKIKSGNYISIHRNKLLTEAFYLTGDIEKYGTGFRRLNEWLDDYPELKYELKDLSGFIQLEIKPVKLSNNERKKINKKLNVPVNVPVNDRQIKIINEIQKNKKITQVELADKYNVNEKTIKRDLKKLKELNLIKRVGADKTGYWQIIKDE